MIDPTKTISRGSLIVNKIGDLFLLLEDANLEKRYTEIYALYPPRGIFQFLTHQIIGYKIVCVPS